MIKTLSIRKIIPARCDVAFGTFLFHKSRRKFSYMRIIVAVFTGLLGQEWPVVGDRLDKRIFLARKVAIFAFEFIMLAINSIASVFVMIKLKDLLPASFIVAGKAVVEIA